MEQKRFAALKHEIADLREKDLNTSLKVQTEFNGQLDYKETKTTIKQLRADDLPIFRKWISGTSVWYYRLRNLNGRIVCDTIIDNTNEMSYRHLTITCVMSEDNVESNQEEFNYAICKLLTHLEK